MIVSRLIFFRIPAGVYFECNRKAEKKGDYVFPEEAKADIRNLVSNKILGLAILLFFAINIQAQTASVIFQSKDNFQVTINKIKQHQTYRNNIRINQLTGNRTYNVQIDFENDTINATRNIYLIDNGLAHIYAIDKSNIQLKKVVPSATYTTTQNQLETIYMENRSIALDTAKKDTTQTKDTTYVVPFASYYKLENYNGKIGCPFPIKEVEQAELRSIILSENLEESKLEKVIFAIQDMDSACVLVSQTKELILLLEFEETRLDFAKFMFAHTFDIDNYEKLYAAFNFENSKDELKLFIKKDSLLRED